MTATTRADDGRVLLVGPLPPDLVERIDARFGAALRRLTPGAADRVVCIATSGKAPVTARDLDALPALRRIACLGAGREGVDAEAAEARGVTVTTTSAVLADDVADLAMGLVIALFRRLLPADAFVRAGRWKDGRLPLGRSLAGARLGLVGVGAIGTAVASRALASRMTVGYTARRAREGAAHPYFPTVGDLAAWADVLVLACPGGAETRRLVDGAVLDALGREGFLINVARGSVVDEAALADALRTGRVAGAGLDVFADEPDVPAALLASDRVVVTPHVGSATVETRAAMARALLASLEEALDAGRPVSDPE